MQGETLICVATRRWDSLWRSTQQILSRIARHNRVIFFEPGRDPDKGVWGEMVRNSGRFFNVEMQEIHENLIVVPCPSSMTYARQHLPKSVLQVTTPAVARLNAAILRRHIKAVMKKLNVQNPQLWLYEPRQSHLIGTLNEKLVCYFNYDEFANFTASAKIKEILRRYDDDLCRRADLVLCTGRAQWEVRHPLNPNTHFIPNAVNYEQFNKALDPQTEIAPEAAPLKKPVIGYTGWMGFQLDAEMLVKLAQTYPQASLLMVGPDDMPQSGAFQTLRELPNVTLTGRKTPDELPGYLKALDVAIIPYQLIGYTLTAYPLKLHEYLAAGRAIVATALPELRPFSDVVRIAENPDEFIRMVGEAWDDNSPEAIEKRLQVARENTWDKRVETIYELIFPLLNAKTAGAGKS